MPNDYPDWSNNSTFADTTVRNTSLLPGANDVIIPVSQFASINITAQNGLSAAFVIHIIWETSTGLVIADEWITSPGDEGISLTFPVIADQIEIITAAGFPGSFFVVTGSNRAIDEPAFISDTILPRFFVYNGALIAGTTFPLAPGDGLRSDSTLNGLCTLFFSCNTSTGLITATYELPNGGTAQIPVGGVTTMGKWFTAQYMHPRTPIKWGFLPDASPGAALVEFLITGN